MALNLSVDEVSREEWMLVMMGEEPTYIGYPKLGQDWTVAEYGLLKWPTCPTESSRT